MGKIALQILGVLFFSFSSLFFLPYSFLQAQPFVSFLPKTNLGFAFELKKPSPPLGAKDVIFSEAKKAYFEKNYDQAYFLFQLLGSDFFYDQEKIKLFQVLLALQSEKPELAKNYYQESKQSQFQPWPQENNFESRSIFWAKVQSALIPGLGMITNGEVRYGMVSFLVNIFLIKGTVGFVQKKNYALAFSFLFFEIPFYFGNVKATEEFVRKKNHALFQEKNRNWVLQLESFVF